MHFGFNGCSKLVNNTNVPQEEGITAVKYTNSSKKNNPPIPTHYLKSMLDLIFKKNRFLVQRRKLQTHGTALLTKMAVAFASIFIAEIDQSA